MNHSLEAFRRIVGGSDTLFSSRLTPGLVIAEDVTAPLASIATTGRITLPGVLDRNTCAAIADAIDDALSAEMPAVAVYTEETLFALGRRVASYASVALGRRYLLADDFWAWKIPPGRSGWPAHRGLAKRLDRSAPEWINTWVALDDVEQDRSCMWLVSLDDDPGYPDDLARIDTRSATAAPLSAGDALAWNANVLHFGGACADDARGPRLSCSYSLVREDAAASLGARLAGTPDLRGRVEAIARQIATYGEGQPDVSSQVLEWARATCALMQLPTHTVVGKDR
jgi:hypothetical protein